MNDGKYDWIKLFKEGDEDAIARIWNEYFPKVIRLARRNIKGPAADEEDIALSAFKSFAKRANAFPKLNDEDDLWKILMTITIRKCVREVKKANQLTELDESKWLDQLSSREPTPEDAAVAADELRLVLSKLHDERTRTIVLLRLEGVTIKEIASRLPCSITTVERKLRNAKRIFQQ